jgi:hypothetical protein
MPQGTAVSHPERSAEWFLPSGGVIRCAVASISHEVLYFDLEGIKNGSHYLVARTNECGRPLLFVGNILNSMSLKPRPIKKALSALIE